MGGQEQHTKIHDNGTRSAYRGLITFILSGLCGWGIYSLIIEMGMEPRAIWFVIGSVLTFLWLIGVSDKLTEAEYEAINAKHRAESCMASLERLREKLYSDIDTPRKV